MNNRSLTSHTHTIANITNLQTELNNRLLTTGGNINGNITFPANNIIFNLNSTTNVPNPPRGDFPDGTQQIRFNTGSNDHARILSGQHGSNNGFLEIATADDGNDPTH